MFTKSDNLIDLAKAMFCELHETNNSAAREANLKHLRSVMILVHQHRIQLNANMWKMHPRQNERSK